MTMAKQLELDQKYVRWELTANIRGVKLSAQCITEEHKEKTLNHWTKLRAKNIQITEHPDAARLPLWRVRMPENSRYSSMLDFTIEARTKYAVQDKLLDNKHYKRWQVFRAEIEEIQREEDTLREELENAKQVEMFACEETPAIEQPEVTTEETPITVETEQAPIEQTEEVKPVEPTINQLTQEEQQLLDEAVTIGKSLNRPFTEREVLAHARKQGYALRLCFDPRFVKVAERNGRQMPLWIVDENQDRLNRVHIANFFGALSDYARRCYSEATSYASTTLSKAYSMTSGVRPIMPSRDELVKQYLAKQGWTLGEETPEAPATTEQPEAINQPDADMSPIEVTHESNISPDHNDKNCMQKTLDTKINLEYNIDNTEKPLTTPKEIAMNQIMTQPEITLSGEQSALLKIMEETRQHMFITGRAGAGKSVLLREFRQTTKKKIVVAAPTGIAALNVRGQTLHSLFKLPPQLYRKGSLTPNPRLYTLLRRIECLVIDEISMVRADILDAIDERLREAHKTDEPFGGIQVIMFGDCYQLPPVVEENLSEYFEHVHGGHFFFNALVWRQADFKVYELTQVFRQKDPVFKDVLNAVRDGSFVDAQLEQLNARYGQTVPADGTVTLAPTNNLVTTINQRKLDQLEGKVYRYKATITGEMKRNVFPTEEILYLKKGAQVVMLKNDKDKRWVNGTVGKIEDLGDDYIDVNIKGIVYTIERDTWDEIAYTYDPDTKKPEAKVVSSFSQYPIRLAWALTIHKSQGQTYESVCIDLTTKTFAPGQMYVALSRCTSLEGLYLSRQVKPDYIIVDAKVKNFMSRVETIIIEEPPIVVEATPVIEAAEEIIQIAQNGTVEPQIEAVTPESEETPATSAKKGRKAKSEDEKVVKTDSRLDPMIREGLDRLMKKLEAKETTSEERARMIPHSTHQIPTISDVMMEALLKLEAFREVNPDLEAAYEEKRGNKKK